MIRPLQETDLDEVTGIEKTAGDVGWTRAHFEAELRRSPVRFYVLTEEGIRAYGGYWIAGPEAQITNLVVRSGFRCQGLARQLLGFFITQAVKDSCRVMNLEVRAANAHARSLYAKMGFEQTGRRPRVYREPEDDAILMEKML